MCTVVVLRRPGHAWPLVVGANRDEMQDRPWAPPARHWPDRADVVAGLDREAGGSWLGLNDHGVVASVLNRRHSLGPRPDKRSRGELVLEALDHADARDAAAALGGLDAGAYRPFNMVVADNRDGFWIKALGEGAPEVFPLPEGISILTAWDRNDTAASDRARFYLPRFEAAAAPDPDAPDWGAWQALLASRAREPGTDGNGAMTVGTEWGFGTVSSSLIALPAPGQAGAEGEARPVWLFAAGAPDEVPYRPVALRAMLH